MSQSPIDELSWELLDHILSFLPSNHQYEDDPYHLNGYGAQRTPSHLPLYATVCKKWAYHFERRTFKSLKIDSTQLDELKRYVKPGYRAASVSRLEYAIILPTYSENACGRFESRKDRNRNDEFFTDAIHGLFKILKSWETESETEHNERSAMTPRSYELHLLATYSPMDAAYRGHRTLNDPKKMQREEHHDLLDRRWEHSFLQLRRVEDLPELSRVSQFISTDPVRNVAPASLASIASKCLNIKNIVMECSDSERKSPGLRQQLRYGKLHDAVWSISDPVCRFLPSPGADSSRLPLLANHDFTVATALHPSSPIDHLSVAIHHLSQAPNLTTLTLSGGIVISPALFWPSDPGQTLPFWPKLQHIDVTFNSTTPGGEWYFMRPPSQTEDWDIIDMSEATRVVDAIDPDTDSESDASDDSATWDSYHPLRAAQQQGMSPARFFRTWPDDEKILPLMTAMAKGLACMPNLQTLTLAHQLAGCLKVTAGPGVGARAVFEVVFIAQGLDDFADTAPEDKKRARIYCQTGEWVPDDEVFSIWNEWRPRDVALGRRSDGDSERLLVKFF
ncbi:hypothetical protein B2J93_8437 [Marssonina coronariae]|uniref:F-box domain-containing protein n=1 Tax=Diplocarpon coronariae TaxID=2795749 RepID=A0A218Z0H5_9HELO|nr:hypothetical protein B2J93_8437 [Marssonina coronariae]